MPDRATLAQDQLQTINPTLASGWDELIGAHPACSFFHGAAWAEVLQNTYGHTPCYLLSTKPEPGIAVRAGELGGRGESASWEDLTVLPLMEVNSPWTGRRAVCLPFTDACAPLVNGRTAYAPLFSAALNLGQQRGWRYLEIRGGDSLPTGARPSVCFVGHRLKLASDEEAVFAAFRPSVRQATRRASREGVVCQIERSYESLQIFYGLHRRTRQRHGLPPQPFKFFENIFASVLSKGHGFLSLARRRGAPVAAAMFFCQGARAVFKYGALDYTFQRSRGSTLAMWEGVRWLCRNGFDELDLGRTSVANGGLRRFKHAFGAQEQPIHYARYDFRKKEFVQDRDLASSGFTHIFRRIPRSISLLVGGLLYRHLS